MILSHFYLKSLDVVLCVCEKHIWCAIHLYWTLFSSIHVVSSIYFGGLIHITTSGFVTAASRPLVHFIQALRSWLRLFYSPDKKLAYDKLHIRPLANSLYYTVASRLTEGASCMYEKHATSKNFGQQSTGWFFEREPILFLNISNTNWGTTKYYSLKEAEIHRILFDTGVE